MDHKLITTTELHVPGYLTSSDPGAVGTGKYWIDTTAGAGLWVLKVRNAANTGWETVGSGGGGGGAPTTADYLVGTPNAGLSAEIAVGTTPGGELGGSWASPTVDASHSGSTHAATQAAAEATASGALTTHAGAANPHAVYRLATADHTHASAGAQAGQVAHSALTGLTTGDPHTQYQLTSAKGAASGYASLDSGVLVPVAQLGTGTPDGTKFLRDDRTWVVPAGGAPSGAAGGDLGGTYPNPTVDDDGHNHTSTTVTTHSTAHVTADISNDAVTYAKMQNVSTTDRILGRDTAGAGDTEELTIAAIMAWNPAINVQVITASGTWTKPADARYVWVRVIGGGGGGGGAASTGAGARSGAGGGGAGGYSEKTFAASALASSESVTVGTGGAGGVGSTPANGTAGNTSSFGTSGTLVQATGGGGGTAGVASSAATNNVGGTGGVGSSGQINSSGDDGGQGSTNVNGVFPGFGGGSSIGGQAKAVDVNTAGTAGRAYGGGGGGGCVGVNNATARTGGLGADGVVIVISYP